MICEEEQMWRNLLRSFLLVRKVFLFWFPWRVSKAFVLEFLFEWWGWARKGISQCDETRFVSENVLVLVDILLNRWSEGQMGRNSRKKTFRCSTPIFDDRLQFVSRELVELKFNVNEFERREKVLQLRRLLNQMNSLRGEHWQMFVWSTIRTSPICRWRGEAVRKRRWKTFVDQRCWKKSSNE